MDRASWRAVIADDYALPEGQPRDQLTRELVGMLGSTDAELRDVFAYPILERWLHADAYAPDEVRGLLAELAANLTRGLGERESDGVFLRAFSVLMLAEVIHYDNARRILGGDEVRQVLEVGLAYFDAERDLRGWVPGKGWAHAVAHGADLLYVLAESPHLDAGDLRRILDAIAAKLAQGGAFYVCGEDDRLARAADAAIRRDLIARDRIASWLEGLTAPLRDFDWLDAAAVERTLDVRHNVSAFVRALFFALGTAARDGDGDGEGAPATDTTEVARLVWQAVGHLRS